MGHREVADDRLSPAPAQFEVVLLRPRPIREPLDFDDVALRRGDRGRNIIKLFLGLIGQFAAVEFELDGFGFQSLEVVRRMIIAT